MIPPSGGPIPNTLYAFYQTKMLPRGSRDAPPKYKDVDKDLIRDIRTQFRKGNLSSDELGTMTNKVNEDNARAFLNRLSTNPKSAQLKAQLAEEGISLTDESDVGPGERFATVAEKAAYISTKYTYTVRTIIPSIVAFGWGFVDPGDATFQEQNREFNTPAERDALGIDVPKSSGGTSSVSLSDDEGQRSTSAWAEMIRRIIKFDLIRVQ